MWACPPPSKNTWDCRVFASAQKTLWLERKISSCSSKVHLCDYSVKIAMHNNLSALVSQFSIATLIRLHNEPTKNSLFSVLPQVHIILTVSQVYFKRNTERVYKDAEVYGHEVQTDLWLLALDVDVCYEQTILPGRCGRKVETCVFGPFRFATIHFLVKLPIYSL